MDKDVEEKYEDEEEEKKKEEEEEMMMSNCVVHILTEAWSTPRSQSHKEICVLPYPNPYEKTSVVERYTSAPEPAWEVINCGEIHFSILFTIFKDSLRWLSI